MEGVVFLLSQAEADILLYIEKLFVDRAIKFPDVGSQVRHEIKSNNGKEKFVLAIVHNTKRPLKCNYTTLYNGSTVLLRVDTEQAIHTNPDGTDVPAPHIHIYREGYEDRYAYPLPESFSDHTDLVRISYDLLRYSNVININDVHVIVQVGLFDENKSSTG